MLKNYFIVAIRVFSKYKSFSLINLIGLTLGITVCLLITQYVVFQLSYDTFHKQKEYLYRVTISYENDEGVYEHHAAISNGLGPFLKNNFPEVVNQTRIIKSSAFSRSSILEYDDGIMKQSREFHEDGIYFVDSTFLEMFTYPIVFGDSESPLAKPNSMVLSESAAKKYFGESNPIGKTLTFSPFIDFEITGVFKDPPLNSHHQFDFLLSLGKAFEKDLLFKDNLHFYGEAYHTYIQLGSDINVFDFQEKIQQSVLEITDRKAAQTAIKLQPITDIHLYSDLASELNQNGSALATYTLSITAILVMLMAWSNFTNLSLLRNIFRRKEAGVRKTLGANKYQLTIQFVLESLIINSFAFVLALAAAELFQPYFSKLLGYKLPTLFSFNPLVFIFLCLTLLGGSILTGLFPSLILTSENTVGMLKSLPKMQTIFSRKVVIFFQMVAVFALITCTNTITKQMNFVHNKDLGLRTEQVLVLNGPKLFNNLDIDKSESYKQFVSKYQTFRSEILQNSSIKAVSSSNFVPGDHIDFTATLENPASGSGTPKQIKRIFVNYDFDKVFELEMVAGRFFSDNFNSEEKSIVLNESAIKLLGFNDAESALNKEIYYWNNPVTIVGVSKDFHFRSLKKRVEPMFFWLNNERTFITLKLKADNISVTLIDINKTWDMVFTDSPFQFFFANEYFNNQYKEDQILKTLIASFTLVALVIASLGLFGLAAFAIQLRTKEIGIRKILGATIANIITLLSKDYLRIVLIGYLIAIPIAWYVMSLWLSNFSYRIKITPEIYALAGAAAILIITLTVSWQVFKAAVANPVESLRNE